MNNKPISDLRRRMIADMTVRSFSDKTQHEYIRHIETLARFLGRSPDTASGDDIRRFQLAQVEQGAQPPKIWRQWQNGRNRFKELRRRGVPKFHAAVAAGSPTGFWRMSGHPAVQQALRNPVFDGLGLPRLFVPAQA